MSDPRDSLEGFGSRCSGPAGAVLAHSGDPGLGLTGFAALPATRHVAGSVLLLSALLTLAGPWLAHSLPGLHAWLPFDCGVAR
jgi:hypothetical protein